MSDYLTLFAMTMAWLLLFAAAMVDTSLTPFALLATMIFMAWSNLLRRNRNE